MSKKLLIGEVAKLHNINTQTLRYYDRIGLFKPKYIDEENQYRYYDIEQFVYLDVILFLKELGMPLNEIKDYIDNLSLSSTINLLKKQEEKLQQEICNLKKKQNSINNKLKMISNYQNYEYEKCFIKKYDERSMIDFNFKFGGNVEEIEYGLKELSNLMGDNLFFFKGIESMTISKHKLLNGKFKTLDSLCVVFEYIDKNNILLKPIPANNYACIIFTGPQSNAPIYIQKLLNWILKNNYEIIGDALIYSIVEPTTSSLSEEYISEIQIPIRHMKINN